MSVHDQIMQAAATPMLMSVVGDRGAVAILGLRPGPPLELDAIVTHEQVTPQFDQTKMEWTERITRTAHVPVSELERVELAEIPSRTRVVVGGVRYVAGQSRLTGSFQTVELRRTELVRQHTGEEGSDS